ncbi:MAG TPA: rhodanese-like domain-containing protein [Bacteroidales bacterium]|nr:rhodanese-like domain-containing protein [Bacteroidales bacterium]
MNTRIKYSACLLSLGFILAVLPYSGHPSLRRKPSELISAVSAGEWYVTPDQVARMIVSNDTIMRLIDVRTPAEYNAFTLPGAVNVPYSEFAEKTISAYLGKGKVKNILFSNGDTQASYAFVLATGLKYNNMYIMKGGMNAWFNSVMNSRFSGELITARENALFETRTKARKLFTEMNSLPDSLKAKLLASKQLDAKKLDGGCE